MIFNKLCNVAVASVISLSTPNSQADGVNLKTIMRIDTKVSDSAYKQKLPNIVAIAKSTNWITSGAIKIDNIDTDKQAFGNHDARLFFLNGEYKNLEDHGTTIKVGLFAPDELTENPLVNGFTSVMMDNYALYGGITGLKADQEISLNDTAALNINGGAGYKYEWLERFGSSGDIVIFSGISLKHIFSDSVNMETGYEYIDFSSNSNPKGADHYTYGKLNIDADDFKYELFGEKINGKRCKDTICRNTDKYNLSASVTAPSSAQTNWRVAAGVNNGQENIELSAFHRFNNGVNSIVGVGHNFETDDNVMQFGLIKVF